MSNALKFCCYVVSVLLLVLLLGACTSVKVEDYCGLTPTLKLEEFFNGKLRADGVVMDRSGKVMRRFSATLDGSWQEKDGKLTGVLDEWFTFDDGERSQRIWQLVKVAENQYNGTAGDVVGSAQGKAAGSAFHFQYVLRIPYDGDTIDVNMDDWMYLLDGKRLFNQTGMYKFGFKVGEVNLMIEKL